MVETVIKTCYQKPGPLDRIGAASTDIGIHDRKRIPQAPLCRQG